MPIAVGGRRATRTMAWLQDAAKDRSPDGALWGNYSREVGKCASLSTAEYVRELLKANT
jgi:hypothetical protein